MLKHIIHPDLMVCGQQRPAYSSDTVITQYLLSSLSVIPSPFGRYTLPSCGFANPFLGGSKLPICTIFIF